MTLWNRTAWELAVERYLCRAPVDRALALLTAVLSATLTVRAAQRGQGSAAVVVLATGGVHALLLAIRLPPARVGVRVLPAAVALVGSQWHLLYAFAPAGARLLSPFVIKVTAAVGAGLFLWSRVSLGRRFGIVPADRGVVTRGPYQWIRHPIYAASFLTSGAFLMDHFSLAAAALWTGGAALAVLKARYEESFLSASIEYGSYSRAVRFRFVPGMI